MRHAFQTLIAATTVATILGAAGSASAANTAAEAKCHGTIAKNMAKYQATLAANLVGCNKARSATGSPANCNTATGADIKGTRTATRSAISTAITTACATTPSVLANYPRCPSPAAGSDDTGATTGIDTFAELATCLEDLSEAYVNRIGEEVMGAPTGPFPLSKGKAACQGAIGKTLSKAIKTVGGVYTKCQAGQEKLLAGLDFDASCLGASGNGAPADASLKASAAIAAIKTAIDASCTTTNVPDQAAWASLGMCGQNKTAMKACAVDRVADPVSRGLASAILELPGTCAAEADVIINGGYGAKLSISHLDSGWKGSAHNVDVVDGSKGGVTLSGCDADCKNCTVTHNDRNGNCRCENDPTIKCDTIEAVGGVCGGANVCHCMFGPPLPLNASNTPVCVVNRFAEQFNGSTGDVGSYSVGTRTHALVHLGINQTQPCPVCKADPTANDGTRGGTCSGGPRNGLSCDANADSPEFGTVSFDCPPSPGNNISGAGLNLALSFTSAATTLLAPISNASFCNTANGNCHCSACSGDDTIGCQTDGDCAAFGAGTCGVNLGLANPAQNNCAGAGVCDSDPSNPNGGICHSGPFDSMCNGFLRGNGRGIINCANDAECDANDCDGNGVVTPGSGECGTCEAAFETRQCFKSVISAVGKPGIFNSEGVSTFCQGKTGNSGVNGAGGLPGPGRVTLDFDFNVYCADGTTRFQEPGGSNCNP